MLLAGHNFSEVWFSQKGTSVSSTNDSCQSLSDLNYNSECRFVSMSLRLCHLCCVCMNMARLDHLYADLSKLISN